MDKHLEKRLSVLSGRYMLPECEKKKLREIMQDPDIYKIYKDMIIVPDDFDYLIFEQKKPRFQGDPDFKPGEQNFGILPLDVARKLFSNVEEFERRFPMENIGSMLNDNYYPNVHVYSPDQCGRMFNWDEKYSQKKEGDSSVPTIRI